MNFVDGVKDTKPNIYSMLGLLALKEETSKGAVAPRAEKTYVRK
jgi:hypothetical protein